MPIAGRHLSSCTETDSRCYDVKNEPILGEHFVQPKENNNLESKLSFN